MTHLCVALFLLVCGVFGFAFESMNAPAVCVWIGFLILVAGEIAYRWDDIK